MSYPASTDQDLRSLQERFALLADLSGAGELLMWDRQTYMPPQGAQARGRQSTALEAVLHEKLADSEVGEWLTRLEESDLEPEDRRFVELCRKRHDQAIKLPARFVEALANARSDAQEAWLEARERRDHGVFAPSLQRLMELVREQAEYIGYDDHPYDALHDDYEPGSSVATVQRVFGELRPRLAELVARIRERGDDGREAPLYGEFDESQQDRFARQEVERFGYDFAAGRLDTTVHPFAQGVGRGDVRITTRYRRNFISAGLFGAFHEAGHGMYEQGRPERWDRSPLGEAVSLGIHESQSRMWENLIGRSHPFWRGTYPRLQEFFPEALRGVSLEEWYRAVNNVKPSLIRVEADEVTYNLHIIIRFELELALLEGNLEARDLPQAWNERYQDLLGITPPDDLEGCLQDVHWSHGLIGYFPTYTLGNIMSVQLMEAMRKEYPDLDGDIEAGEFERILTWLRENVHRHGSRYQPEDLLERATGSKLDAGPYLRYLEEKFGPLYD